MTWSPDNNRIVGIVLAGGSSRRMGQDKALLDVGGRPLIARAVDALLACLPRVIIVTASPQRYSDVLAGRPVSFTQDHITDGGPLAGMHAGLCALEPRELGAVTIGCDMPFISPRAVSFLAARLCNGPGTGFETPINCPAVAFSDLDERPQHLLNGLARSVVPTIERYLERDSRRSVGGFFASLGLCYTPITTLLPPCEAERVFWNVNTPDELERARKAAYTPNKIDSC